MRIVLIFAVALAACGKRVPRCTELAARRAEREAEFVPLRKEACRAYTAGDEGALYAAYVEMFKKSEAMLAEFPAQQECRTSAGEKDTYDLTNREDAEAFVRMGVEASYRELRDRLVSICPASAASAANSRSSKPGS